MLRPELSVDLLDTRAQFYWPVRELQFIKGTAHILRAHAEDGPGFLINQYEMTVQIQHHLGHRPSVKGCLPEADMAHEVIVQLQVPGLRHDQEPIAQRRLGHLRKDAMLEVHWVEKIGA